MSSQILQTELANLIQESKRKYSDLRNAAEQSLNDLKALPSTSEAQITADLIRRPHFVAPFILACQTRQPKLASIGIICLQRLATSRAISPGRLNDTLSALRDITGLSQDVQLKILQTLPALLHNYSDELSGDLLASILEVCAILQASKVGAVSNSAAATLQQLVSSAFEKVSVEDSNVQSATTVQAQVDGSTVDIGVAAYDALQILGDFCRVVEGEKLEYLRIKTLPHNFVLELIESILVNNIKLFRNHPEQMKLLKNRLLPLTVKYLSEKHTFAQTLRVIRILLVLLRNFMGLLPDESEIALGLLTHLLEPGVSPDWKRVLLMEVFRSLHSEPSLIRLMYSLFDDVEGKKDIVKDHITSIFKIASENSSLIGVSHQSTVPSDAHSRTNTDDQIALEAGGVAGVIAAAVDPADESVTGISIQWSMVRTPYLELLDKSEPPPPPETYIYCLVLNCLSALSEGLARFIIPLTVTESKSKRRKRNAMNERGTIEGAQELQRSDSTRSNTSESKRQTVPLNPLELQDHPQSSAIRSSAGIIESCWPVILATCSIFFYAALDADFYHNLVRCFQKLTHVAGLLRQSSARDAFLSTLGKTTLPVDEVSAHANAKLQTRQSVSSDAKVPDQSLNAHFDTPKSSFESARASLSTRNLLCLRALLNLGIALGPTMDRSAWSIILETLQNADLVINASATSTTKQTPVVGNGEHSIDIPRGNIGNEILAVSTAASKMFESTAEYPDTSFQAILEALLGMLSTKDRGTLTALQPLAKTSTNQSLANSRIQEDEINLVLDRTKELCEANIERLSVVGQDEDVIWDILNMNLKITATNNTYSRNLRIKASSILNYIILQTMKNGWFDEDSRNTLQLRNLQSLQSQIMSLYQEKDKPMTIDAEAHGQALDTLKIMLEEYGEAFTSGWDLIFELISSVFENTASIAENKEDVKDPSMKSVSKARDFTARSPRLVRAAYASLQLIASDFLTLLPASCLLELVDSLSLFATQDQDFNISLTTTTFFWNVSDFLQSQVGKFSIEDSMDTSIIEESLVALTDVTDISTSRGALWLLLLLRIVDLTTDDRSGIRNSAIHTLLRILDAYGPQLSPKAWHLCLNRVLFVMMLDIQNKMLATESLIDEKPDQVKEWIETSVVAVKGSTDLIATFFDTIIQDRGFDDSWKRLLDCFQELIHIDNNGLREAVFASLCNIIKNADTPGSFSKEVVRCAWLLWVNNHLAPEGASLDPEEPNQDALIAYFRFYQQVYRLYRDELSQALVVQILQHMRMAIWNSIVSRYSVDVDHQSSLQELVLECIKILCLEKDESQSIIALCLADFSDSALTQWTPDQDKSRPSFVAFSKNAIDLLGWYIAEHGIKVDIFSDGTLTCALQHLAHPITRKYEWRGKDREQLVWQKATTSTIKIIRVAVPYVESKYDVSEKSNIVPFWTTVVEIARGIISADNYSDFDISTSRIAADEDFDIEAFKTLVPLLIPSLGANHIPDSIRRDFSCILFQSSLIYLPQRIDTPIETLLKSPLDALYKIRRGRTYDPEPTARSRIAYVLIDTMFELAQASSLSSASSAGSIQGDGKESSTTTTAALIALARSILPYLILRSFLPLKSYIADQPLRGLLPQPAPAHRELVYILDSLYRLQSEPAAIPDAPSGVVSSSPSVKSYSPSSSSRQNSSTSTSTTRHKFQLVYSKHLGWVYPLIVKCVQVAGKQKGQGQGHNDTVILQHLTRILDAVCDEDEDEEEEDVD